MASGRDLHGIFGIGAGVQIPYHQRSDSSAAFGGGGLLKRSLTELERQQQMQHAIFLRSVKQRTHLAVAEISSSPASSSSSISTASGFPQPAPAAIRNSLEELERRLLDDDDDDDDITGSTITAAEWGETTIQQLMSSPSPTTSSTASSCSPISATTTPSRQLLLDTATAIADGNSETAAANLAVLQRAANPRGDPEQRLTAIMVTALLSRINSPGIGIGSPEIQAATTQQQQQRLFGLCPCFKLALLAANLAILDATRDAPKIHILDLDIVQSAGQHANLIHTLADRHRRSGSRPPAVRITAVCDPTTSSNHHRLVGDHIARLADQLGVGLEFTILKRRATEIDDAAIGREARDALAVNLAFQLSRVADESVSPANPRDEILRRVRDLRPRVVALAEQEVNGNTAPFAARFAEACGHYGAVLESMDAAATAAAARESGDRAAAEAEACVARKAANSVAREGAERVERCEVFGKWRARMGMAGLRSVPVGPAVSEPVRVRVASLRGINPGFTVREENGGLCFSWMGRVLTVASAWR